VGAVTATEKFAFQQPPKYTVSQKVVHQTNGDNFVNS